MLNFREIMLIGDIIRVSVEPLLAKHRSFRMEVDIRSREIVRLSLSNDTLEVRKYSEIAKNELLLLYDNSCKNHSKMPEYFYIPDSKYPCVNKKMV